MTCLEKPIVIIGAARSGTYLLSSIISAHKSVAYIGESNYVWKYSNAWLRHDMIPASQATPIVIDYIRGKFQRFCEETGKSRFCEKTPANSLRLPFVMKILPDAKVIHITRDGRDVAVSARKKVQGNIAKVTQLQKAGAQEYCRGVWRARVQNLIRRGSHHFQTGIPASDLIYYLPDFAEYLLVQLGLRKKAAWGPRIPGLKQLLKSHSVLEVCAIQWRICVEQVINYTSSNPDMDYLQIKFEDLCSSPRKIADQIFDFCKLTFPEGAKKRLNNIIPFKHNHYSKNITDIELRLLNDNIAQTLRLLGYEA